MDDPKEQEPDVSVDEEEVEDLEAPADGDDVAGGAKCTQTCIPPCSERSTNW
jgi:hypothetical protein